MHSNVRVLELAAQLTAFGILPVFFFVSSRGICSLSLGILFDNDSLSFDMAFEEDRLEARVISAEP